MKKYQVIPTAYKGVTFRSRLEARVAVFLDNICAPWCYEHEAFSLGGRNYLPDFWLPETYVRGGPALRCGDPVPDDYSPVKGVWLEVKPNDWAKEDYGPILSDLAALTGHHAYYFDGDLNGLDWFGRHTGRCPSLTEYSPEGGDDHPLGFQSDGRETRIEFSEGNYTWGDPAVTYQAWIRAVSMRFEPPRQEVVTLGSLRRAKR